MSLNVAISPSSESVFAPRKRIVPKTKTANAAGTERIAAQIGKGKFANVNTSIANADSTAAKLTAVNSIAPYLANYATSQFTYLNTLPILSTTEKEIYYYHTDHLGSSAWITDSLGIAVQHLAYLPWGEPYVTQKTGNFNPTYTFSGKERDEETGYSYFGQRFYDSEHSFWLSVDPMRGKYPQFSPFVYCANNPIKLVDPNGDFPINISHGVYFVFYKSSIGVGVGYALSASYASGVSFDKAGTTYFSALSTNHINNQNLYEYSQNPSYYASIGAGVNITLAVYWGVDNFEEATGIGVSSYSLGIGYGAGLGCGDHMVSVSVGCDFGGGMDYSNMNITSSLSISKEEYNTIKSPLSIAILVDNISPVKDKNDNVTGYQGTVETVNILGIKRNTNIKVYSGVDKNGNTNNRWKSKEYESQLQ